MCCTWLVVIYICVIYTMIWDDRCCLEGCMAMAAILTEFLHYLTMRGPEGLAVTVNI